MTTGDLHKAKVLTMAYLFQPNALPPVIIRFFDDLI